MCHPRLSWDPHTEVQGRPCRTLLYPHMRTEAQRHTHMYKKNERLVACITHAIYAKCMCMSQRELLAWLCLCVCNESFGGGK